MNNVRPYVGPQSEAKPPQADIVFCVDSTGSMQPCIDSVKNNLHRFIDKLTNPIKVDFRLRLISYRDKHDPENIGDPWLETEFMALDKLNEFREILNDIEANGGGPVKNGESTLDALYLAIHSPWRSTAVFK